jgi:putative flippase GtrA
MEYIIQLSPVRRSLLFMAIRVIITQIVLMTVLTRIWAHKELIARYVLAGTLAWTFTLCIQHLLVENAGLTPTQAYPLQFTSSLLVYYYLLRKLVWREDHFRWKKHFHKLGGVKIAQALSVFVLFEVTMAIGLNYILATVVSTLVVGPAFLFLTKEKVFIVNEEEAMA